MPLLKWTHHSRVRAGFLSHSSFPLFIKCDQLQHTWDFYTKKILDIDTARAPEPQKTLWLLDTMVIVASNVFPTVFSIVATLATVSTNLAEQLPAPCQLLFPLYELPPPYLAASTDCWDFMRVVPMVHSFMTPCHSNKSVHWSKVSVLMYSVLLSIASIPIAIVGISMPVVFLCFCNYWY